MAVDSRRQRYFKLRAQIAQMDNAALRALLEDGESNAGWGRHHTMDLSGTKIFVKRIPVAALEYENLLSTGNLYRLPTYYNYGVGSAGLGVFRELVAHIKTTSWVLSGEIEGFPLLYHHRIVPFWGRRANVDVERHNGYVEYWGGSANVGKYMLDRANAGHELLLFLEHVPHTLVPWLLANSHETPRVLDDLRSIITVLRSKGIIHFDAHYWNILTDGERTYLTDFGLVLDQSFALDPDERLFFERHRLYDYGEILCSLDTILHSAYGALSAQDKRRLGVRYGIREGMTHWELGSVLLDNVERMHEDGIPKLDRNYVDSVIRYRKVMALMAAFFADMQRNRKKDTGFPHEALARLLGETGFLPQAPASPE